VFAGLLAEFRVLTHPREVAWSASQSAESFIDVYDWDTIVVGKSASPLILATDVTLCTWAFPCQMKLRGEGDALLHREGSRSIVCAASLGCGGVAVDSLGIQCEDREAGESLIKVQNSTLRVANSSFRGCLSKTDGAVVQAFGGSFVTIEDSRFIGARCAGFGGAIAIVDSLLNVSKSEFVDCSSERGGGAISTSFFHNFRTDSNSVTLGLHVIGSRFDNCSSLAAGGAMLISSKSLDPGNAAFAKILSAGITRCRAVGNGGGVRVESEGGVVVAGFDGCTFDGCSSATAGGAVSGGRGVILKLSASAFKRNRAEGLGGGAVHVEGAALTERGCSFADNKASAGGGGALLVEDGAESEIMRNPPRLACPNNNTALYGPCVASTFKALEVATTLPPPAKIFAGFAVQLIVIKKDAYGQVISADSASLVRVLTSKSSSSGAESTMAGTTVGSLADGRLSLNLSFFPRFPRIDYANGNAYLEAPVRPYIEGLDSDQTNLCSESRQMQSNVVDITYANGTDVCPSGYILAVDDYGYGSCTVCGPGTYSLRPLAGAVLGRVSCLTCPAGSTCYGGRNVSLSMGTWNETGGKYVLVGCPERHQLVNSVGGVFSHDVQRCLACADSEYILNSNDPAFSCQKWTALVYVSLTVDLAVPKEDFTLSRQLSFAVAVAAAANVPVQDIMLSTVVEARRSLPGSIKVSCRIAAQNESAAVGIAGGFSLSTLNSKLGSSGLPPASNLATTVTNERVVVGGAAGNEVSSDVLKIPLATILSSIVVYFILRSLYKYYIYREFINSLQASKPGEVASQKHLPFELKKRFKAEEVLELSRHCFTLKATRSLKGSDDVGKVVAIKPRVPEKTRFNSDEMKQLAAEAKILELVTEKKCAFAANLAAGSRAFRVNAGITWFVLGDANVSKNMLNQVFYSGHETPALLNSKQCIKLACDVLDALRLIHSEKFIHRDIRPAHILRYKDPLAARGSIQDGQSKDSCDRAFLFKLIDFSCAADLRDPTDAPAPSPFMSGDAAPYTSPEMFASPGEASFPSDLWSLGVTMFHLTTGQLPLEVGKQGGGEKQDQEAWRAVVAGDLDSKVPSVLDRMEADRRAKFDSQLAQVVTRALEKRVEDRYKQASEMRRDLHRCLVRSGDASYSVFISYRVASESPLANLIFDELNQTVTPGGHRVTVYLDEVRLVKGEDWEEGFSVGLLNSLCFFPLLSYGATAPMARLPEETHLAKVHAGWEERPCGRARLEGAATDAEDNVLKEFLIAGVLKERSRLREAGDEKEKGKLQAVYPIFVGRQEPEGHPQ
jgi:serine/threonine protein kinase